LREDLGRGDVNGLHGGIFGLANVAFHGYSFDLG
jgi:hypothetical protein